MTAATIAPMIVAKLVGASETITTCANDPRCMTYKPTGRPHINHRLTLMLYGTSEEREAARTELLTALQESKGLVGPVCEKLQLTRPLYSRLIKRAGLADVAAEIRNENGQPGPKTAQVGQEHARAGERRKTGPRPRKRRYSSAAAK